MKPCPGRAPAKAALASKAASSTDTGGAARAAGGAPPDGGPCTPHRPCRRSSTLSVPAHLLRLKPLVAQPALLCVDHLEGGLHQRLRRRCLCFLVFLGLLLSVVHVLGGDAVSAIDQLQLRTRPAVNSLCTVVNMFSGDRELYCC